MADSLTDSIPETPTRRPRWWFSKNERIGFCWSNVTAHDFRPNTGGEHGKATLYLYVQGGILHLIGNDAEEVFKELQKR